MKWLFTLLLLAILQPIWPQYQPDILGDNYLQRTFRMTDDYEGEVVCTLVKRTTDNNTHDAILYVHGYNDYFFQRELGDSVNARGYNFYALDLRKYGRSLRPHQDAFFCKDLGEYFADIDTALATIRSEGNERIWLMGHSTGGLITSYYLHERQDHCPVDGLILNSPFLDWNFGWGMENILLPAVSFIGGYFPNLTAQNGGAFSQYGASLLKRLKGEWDFNDEWKKLYAHPKKAGWIHAIHAAQQELQEEANLDCPVLVLSSDQSLPEGVEWKEGNRMADIVLDVEDIQEYGRQLGPNVTYKAIHNGIHDLILSGQPARDEAYQTIFRWLASQKSH